MRPLPDFLALDIDGARVGAYRPRAVGERFSRPAGTSEGLRRGLERVVEFGEGAEFLLGHNILDYDLRIVREVWADSPLLEMPVVDTLLLSPLCFPARPYHGLVKDYDLAREGKSDPAEDARLSAELLGRELEMLEGRFGGTAGLAPSGGSASLQAEASVSTLDEPSLRKCLLLGLARYSFQHAAGLRDLGGMGQIFGRLGAAELEPRALHELLLRRLRGEICATRGPRILNERLGTSEGRLSLLFSLAWIEVAPSGASLPGWVRRRIQGIGELVQSLRGEDCGDASCSYCRTEFDARTQLRKSFGYEDFRPEPRGPDGESLQRRIVEEGLRGQSMLATLPTGAGKSLCFQVPALSRYRQRGALTVVISPLQSLMQDQVEGLRKKVPAVDTKGIAATLNGQVTPPERAAAIDGVTHGRVGILYLAPEQLRNKSIRKLLEQREVAAWVFDEAHCLSKWGHDFRPDYLYSLDFIAERIRWDEEATASRLRPSIVCVTATARKGVKGEILRLVKEKLGVEMLLFEGGVERTNLEFSAQRVQPAMKKDRVRAELQKQAAGQGAAIVYHRTRKETREMAEAMASCGLRISAYNAGLDPQERRQIQQRFVGGASHSDLDAICATNAFGMGVDKADIRLVLHSEVPGSLENYLQEAGRAGRDGEKAQCRLLYCPEDLEAQFDLANYTRLRIDDLNAVLRALKRVARRLIGKGESPREQQVVLSAAQIMREQDGEDGFSFSDQQAPSKVRTAIAWLERAGFVRRTENENRIFLGAPLVESREQAERILDAQKISGRLREMMLDTLRLLFLAREGEMVSADEIAGTRSFIAWKCAHSEESELKHVMDVLNRMVGLRLIERGMQFTAWLGTARARTARSAKLSLHRIAELERLVIKLMQECAPDLERGQAAVLSLRELTARIKAEGVSCHSAQCARLLRVLSQGRVPGSEAERVITLFEQSRDRFKAKMHCDLDELRRMSEQRLQICDHVVEELVRLAKTQGPREDGPDVRFGMEDLERALGEGFRLSGRPTPSSDEILEALGYLHEHDVLTLQGGLAIFSQAMTLIVKEPRSRLRYTLEHYRDLDQHYREQTLQIHFMQKYAELAAAEDSAMHDYVRDYFELEDEELIQRYFPVERHEALRRATSSRSSERILGALSDKQRDLVELDPAESVLVLAGPGAGKTRVLAHRCAYLLKVRRVDPRSILVLCFNRSTAIELRSRIHSLVGKMAARVTIQTYHGFSARLIGASFESLGAGLQAEEGNAGGASAEESPFDRLLREATALLREGEAASTGESGSKAGIDDAALREDLLEGYQYLLVDEYQDINTQQYELVKAITGFSEQGSETAKLAVFAVGDDDQCIYQWRDANLTHIESFQADYGAQKYSLLVNYRSAPEIVRASNSVIGLARKRLKEGERLEARANAPHGVVQRTEVGHAGEEARWVAEQILAIGKEELRKQGRCAVLGSRHVELGALRHWLEEREIPVSYRRSAKAFRVKPWKVRELRRFFAEIDRVAGAMSGTTQLEIGREELKMARDGLRDLGSRPWLEFIDDLILAWERDAGKEARSTAADVKRFFYELMQEGQRFGTQAPGVFLGTVHAAKGLEFETVFLLGGRWGARGMVEHRDEMRRVYYVGMTRAIRELFLMDRRCEPNPFLQQQRMQLQTHVAEAEAAYGSYSTYEYRVLGFEDLDLDFAGRREAAGVKRALKSVRAGDLVGVRAGEQHTLLTNGQGQVIARLSKHAHRALKEPLAKRDHARVLAVVERRSDESKPEFREMLEVDTWELPIVELCFRS